MYLNIDTSQYMSQVMNMCHIDQRPQRKRNLCHMGVEEMWKAGVLWCRSPHKKQRLKDMKVADHRYRDRKRKDQLVCSRDFWLILGCPGQNWRGLALLGFALETATLKRRVSLGLQTSFSVFYLWSLVSVCSLKLLSSFHIYGASTYDSFVAQSDFECVSARQDR